MQVVFLLIFHNLDTPADTRGPPTARAVMIIFTNIILMILNWQEALKIVLLTSY